MADPTDYRALYLKEAEFRRQAEQGERQEKERNRQTTFEEFIQHCHDLLSRPLSVEDPSRSTTGTIPAPTGKFCPLRFRPWIGCKTKQRELYNSVCGYLQPVGRDAPRLFAPLIALEDHGRRFARRPIGSEQDLVTYERLAVEDHVHDIISELSKIPSARDEFRLSDGIPDQLCIHRVDGGTNTLLTTAEYKPPHKLSVENLRAGLRPIDFYHEIVELDTIPASGPEKLRYNATRLTGSAVVQEFHAMIEGGLK